MKISFPPIAQLKPLGQVKALSVIRHARHCYLVTGTADPSADFDDGSPHDIMCVDLLSGALVPLNVTLEVEPMAAQLTVGDPVMVPGAPLRPEDVVVSTIERDEIRANRKIQAIRILRERTGLGLKDAKEVIDREAERMQTEYTRR